MPSHRVWLLQVAAGLCRPRERGQDLVGLPQAGNGTQASRQPLEPSALCLQLGRASGDTPLHHPCPGPLGGTLWPALGGSDGSNPPLKHLVSLGGRHQLSTGHVAGTETAAALRASWAPLPCANGATGLSGWSKDLGIAQHKAEEQGPPAGAAGAESAAWQQWDLPLRMPAREPPPRGPGSRRRGGRSLEQRVPVRSGPVISFSLVPSH